MCSAICHIFCINSINIFYLLQMDKMWPQNTKWIQFTKNPLFISNTHFCWFWVHTTILTANQNSDHNNKKSKESSIRNSSKYLAFIHLEKKITSHGSKNIVSNVPTIYHILWIKHKKKEKNRSNRNKTMRLTVLVTHKEWSKDEALVKERGMEIVELN